MGLSHQQATAVMRPGKHDGHSPGVSSAFGERLGGGRYVNVEIDRDAAANYGMNIAEV